jgi:predicted RNA binding protein YcfA (HicA-like mRNA interferase family)
MKRRRLLRHLEKDGCRFLREGGDHTLYFRPGTDRQAAVPRHREIKPHLVRKICKALDVIPPTEK